MMQIKLYKDGKLPEYVKTQDSAMDCYSAEEAEWILDKGFYTATVRLGFGCLVPHEYGLFLLSRSGQGFNHSINLINCVGLIDRSFGLNEIKCKLIMHKITLDTPEPIKIGQRVCQMVLMSTPEIYLDVVKDGIVGKGGFGSSGNE